MDAFTLNFLRAVGTSCVYFLIFVGRERSVAKLRLTQRHARVLVLYGLAITVSSGTFMGAYLHTTFANTILLHYVAPIIVIVLSTKLLGERLRLFLILPFLLAMSGVAMIIWKDFTLERTGENILGNVLALTSAFGFAGIVLCTRYTRKLDIDIYYTVFWAWTIVAIVSLPMALLWGHIVYSWSAFKWILLLAVLSTVIPFILLNKGMRTVHASRASMITFSEMVFVILLGYIFYQEPLSLERIAGGLAICSAVILSQRSTILQKT